MTIINIHPQAGVPGQLRVGDGTTIEEVFDDIRQATFDGVVVVPETHQYAIEEFHELLDEGRYIKDNVRFLLFPPLKQQVHVPACGPREWKLVRASDGKVVGQEAASAQPATTKEIERKRYADFSTKQHARYIASQLPQSTKIVVIWEPCVEAGDLDCLSELKDVQVVIYHRLSEKYGVVIEGEGAGDWRASCYTITELPEEKTVDFIEHLLPEKAYTKIPAPSYTGKTHIAVEMGLSLATGTNFLGHFKGPSKPVPVTYHVPEMNSALFKEFMHRLNAKERLQGKEDMFLMRPLEVDLWQLDSPKMVESSQGRYVFLDTFGYFNDGDDTSNYNDAIEFAKKINNLIRQGCLGVCGLYHPPKYAKKAKETGNVMTLENQILGSAGYGGLLRSCLGVRNLHKDPNMGLWVYVQGLKNPGLGKPFQIKGLPLEYLGESPYLSELLKTGSRKEQALAMLAEGKTRDETCKTLGVSPNSLTK